MIDAPRWQLVHGLFRARLPQQHAGDYFLPANGLDQPVLVFIVQLKSAIFHSRFPSKAWDTEDAKVAEGAEDSRLFTMRLMPSLRWTTLKLINSPNCLPLMRRYDKSCALCTGAIASMDFTSTRIRLFTTRSSR